MEKIAPSDIPQSVLDSIKDDAENKFPIDERWERYYPQLYLQAKIERSDYAAGRQEQLQKDLEFVEWAFEEQYKFDATTEKWSYHYGKKHYTTIELYQEYLKSKK